MYTRLYNVSILTCNSIRVYKAIYIYLFNAHIRRTISAKKDIYDMIYTRTKRTRMSGTEIVDVG